VAVTLDTEGIISPHCSTK